MAKAVAKKEVYPHVATSLEGFVFQLAVSYFTNSKSYFYVCGEVPSWRATEEHDEKMLREYDVAVSKWTRYRRRKVVGPDGRRFANCHYIRHESFWVLACQEGSNRFFSHHQQQDDAGNVTSVRYLDVRRNAVQYGGYSIGLANGRLSVRLAKKAYEDLTEYYLSLSLKSLKAVAVEFHRFPFEPWGGVLRQLRSLLKEVNKRRAAAGLPRVPGDVIRAKRFPVKPFAEPHYARSGRKAVGDTETTITALKEAVMKTEVAKQDGVELRDVCLFENGAEEARRRGGQRDELRATAESLRQMFRELGDELSHDRDRSIAMVYEYRGLLEQLVDRINVIREGTVGSGLDKIAEKLEQGVSYLHGVFTAFEPSDRRSWPMDRVLLKSSMQRVSPMVGVLLRRLPKSGELFVNAQARKAA